MWGLIPTRSQVQTSLEGLSMEANFGGINISRGVGQNFYPLARRANKRKQITKEKKLHKYIPENNKLTSKLHSKYIT